MKVKLINASEIKNEMRIAGWMASVSYDSKGDAMKIAEHCIKSGHGTPTRPMRFLFEISEVSRAFSHEFVRHEEGVYKVQRSQRYVNEDGFGYVTPKSLKEKKINIEVPIHDQDGEVYDYAFLNLDFDGLQDIIKQFYVGAMEQGIKAEDARYALTNATHTKLHVSFDFEGLQQFCYRRCCTRAQWEIREVAEAIRLAVLQELPFLEPHLGAPCHIHGYCPEAKGCGRAPSKTEFLWTYKVGESYLKKQK
jgi:thymidylate synthase (FAD)